jgi:hypothetical protein
VRSPGLSITFALVAPRTKNLQILYGVCPSTAKRDDVVVLDVEGRAAALADAAIA